LAVGIVWRALINAIAIVVAAYVVNIYQPDAIKWGQVDYGMGELGRYLSLILTGLTLGVVNAIIKPILVMVSMPITCLTLGLFIFVINALMLLLVSAIPFLGFVVNGFIVALAASVVISVVSWALSMVLPD
jgi:putative membrane protein